MLDLFILETCPYCKKVMDFLDKTKVKYRKIDISDKDSENSLIQIGGKRQVPFLIDNERNIQMYESDDIIEYLKTIC
jgi:glutaredoxin